MASTFADLWTELKADASAFVTKVETGAESFVANIVPVLEQDLVTVLGQVKDAGLQMVATMASEANSALSGQEKLSNVVDAVVQAAEALGLQLAIQDARMFAQQLYLAFSTAVAAAMGTSTAATS